MIKRSAFINLSVLMIAVLLSACVSFTGMVLQQNRENLLKLSVGMNKQQVLDAMGTETIRGINNPYRIETMTDQEGRIYEVLFYYTDKKVPYMADSWLTPIIIIDGRLVGWGRMFYTEYVNKHEIRMK